MRGKTFAMAITKKSSSDELQLQLIKLWVKQKFSLVDSFEDFAHISNFFGTVEMVTNSMGRTEGGEAKRKSSTAKTAESSRTDAE